MKIHSSQPLSEFLDDVRFRAAQSGAPPALIDKLDELIGQSVYDAEIEKLGEELTAKEKAFDDLRDELRLLYEAIIDHNESAHMIDVHHPAMKAACDALSRHDS